jgi:hypothetical protein
MTTDSDPWKPIRRLAGTWEGESMGQPGQGTAARTYAFVLNDGYLHERNVSTYSAQEPDQAGEVHEHWSFFSYDRQRNSLVFRQFHQEGFVNQYKLSSELSGPSRAVFESESFENFDSSWRARETYVFFSDDEFEETFELARPGTEFSVYSKTIFKRANPSS